MDVPTFLNPDLSDDDREALEVENWVCLMTVQSMLGLISTPVTAVAVEVRLRTMVTLHVALVEWSKGVVDDVMEIVGELEGFLPSTFVVQKPVVHVGPVDAGWPGRQHRLLYRAKS